MRPGYRLLTCLCSEKTAEKIGCTMLQKSQVDLRKSLTN